jgi:hypothetical protein
MLPVVGSAALASAGGPVGCATGAAAIGPAAAA